MSWAASLPGQNFFSQKSDVFLHKPLVPGSFAAWGQNFFLRNLTFLNKPLVQGSCVAWGRTFPIFEQATCAAWNITSSQKSVFLLKNPLVWGSCAAWGRTLFQKSVSLGRSHLSGAAALPGEKQISEISCLARQLCSYVAT